jgi:hypothetical protein
MAKIIYFTASAIPTETEAGHIAAFAAYPGIDLAIRNAAAVGISTDQGEPELADYVANATGADFPVGYDDTEDYPIASPTNPPVPAGILSTQKIITSGVEFLSPDQSGSWVDGHTPTIVAGAVTVLAGS